MTTRQYNIIGLILGVLALLLLVCWRLSVSDRIQTRAVSAAAGASAPALATIPRGVPEDYAQIAANNLFHPLRGKAPAEAPSQVQKDNKPLAVLNFELKGIYHSGKSKAALIQLRGNAPGAPSGELKKADANLIYVGNEISGGYILQEVRNRSVIIVRGSEKIEVELQMLLPPDDSEKSPKASPAPAAIPAAPKKE